MPVITDIDADFGIAGFKYRESQVAGLEIKLFPESRPGVRNVDLSKLPEIGTVGIHDGGRIVVDTVNFHFVNGNDHYHPEFFGVFG